jgi:hypothetical protein
VSTNYYAEGDATCNNPEHTELLHIGQSAGGWKFSFHGIPDRGLTSWAAWRDFLAARSITDEYDRPLTLDEFAEVVEKRWTPNGRIEPRCRVEHRNDLGRGGQEEYHDADGFDFYNGTFS